MSEYNTNQIYARRDYLKIIVIKFYNYLLLNFNFEFHMGNICCQTQTQNNPIVGQSIQEYKKEVFKKDEYVTTQLPEDDQILTSWIKQNNFQIPIKTEDSPSESVMKHSIENRYYIGGWKDGFPDGKAVVYQPQKLLFNGVFEEGQPTGRAQIKFIKQSLQFEGDIKQGRANGHGKLQNIAERYQFEGQWKDSKPEKGILTLVNDDNISSIQFTDFEKGLAIIHYKDLRRYEGEILTNKLLPHGKGKVEFSNNQKQSYEGQWHEGVIHGKGLFKWIDGSSYDGQFIQGKKSGFGKFHFANGSYYDGYWVNGKQDGVGTLYSKNGAEVKKGKWVNGQFQGELEPQKYQEEKNQSQIRRQGEIEKYQKLNSKINRSLLQNSNQKMQAIPASNIFSNGSQIHQSQHKEQINVSHQQHHQSGIQYHKSSEVKESQHNNEYKPSEEQNKVSQQHKSQVVHQSGFNHQNKESQVHHNDQNNQHKLPEVNQINHNHDSKLSEAYKVSSVLQGNINNGISGINQNQLHIQDNHESKVPSDLNIGGGNSIIKGLQSNTKAVHEIAQQSKQADSFYRNH